MVAEEVVITLAGGAPWGFRLQGGVEHQKPLQVAKVRGTCGHTKCPALLRKRLNSNSDCHVSQHDAYPDHQVKVSVCLMGSHFSPISCAEGDDIQSLSN